MSHLFFGHEIAEIKYLRGHTNVENFTARPLVFNDHRQEQVYLLQQLVYFASPMRICYCFCCCCCCCRSRRRCRFRRRKGCCCLSAFCLLNAQVGLCFCVHKIRGRAAVKLRRSVRAIICIILTCFCCVFSCA